MKIKMDKIAYQKTLERFAKRIIAEGLTYEDCEFSTEIVRRDGKLFVRIEMTEREKE